MQFRWVLFYLIFSSVMFISCAEVKQAGRDIGHGTRDATKAIGHATRDAVKAVGKETKEVLNGED